MVQPEPYEVVHTVQEPIVTHHVSYKEALPATETVAYQQTGYGPTVVDGWQEVLPVEPAHWNDPRLPTGQASPVTYGGVVVDPVARPAYVEPVIGGPVVAGRPGIVEPVVAGRPVWRR